jgi:Ser/Thr protein kinase RdoA (MazF antagonist)
VLREHHGLEARLESLVSERDQNFRLRCDDGRQYVAGNHSVTPLEISEVDMLFDLIKTRPTATITILSWRETLRGADDPYLAGAVASESSAADFLKVLLELPRENAQQTFRQISASVDTDLKTDKD